MAVTLTRPTVASGGAAAATLVALLAALLLVPAAPAHAAGAAATFHLDSDWGTGFQGTYTITNTTPSAITGWRLDFDLSPNEAVGTFWDAQITSSAPNHHTAVNLGYDATIAPGGSVTFGFVASYSGTRSDPANCTVNGGPCASGGGAGGDTVAPSVPTGLHAGTATATSVPLAWTAATDNVGVTGYRVLRGGAVVATVTGTEATVTGLTPATTSVFTVRAVDAAGNRSGPSDPVTVTTPAAGGGGTGGGGGGGFLVAPYVDMGSFPTPNLVQMATDSGLRDFTLGFVTGPAGCAASWFNAFDPAGDFEKADIAALRAMGGDVQVSFGGEAGAELAQSCTDVTNLTAQYQAVVSNYSLTAIDFDIEGAAVADPASVQRRSQAMAALQRQNPGLRISLTLPVLPEGLTADGVNVVRAARDAGVDVNVVNVMAFDYSRAGDRGDQALQAAQSVHDQLQTLYPTRTDAQLWAMVGVTAMIGQADDMAIFDQADAAQLVAFAGAHHLGGLSFWELTRDRNACTGALFMCTNVPQQPYDFSRIFTGFVG
ncbi:MAG TPA: cellulose binding domain-containing protein [Mycobacteriales bacterium]|nr:cellulose binding domain-containing protein [Mycobacteriales bacterium]